MILSKDKHPIMQMRDDAMKKEHEAELALASNRHKKTRSNPPRYERSITFFNTQQAEIEKKKEQLEVKGVFKLSPSVEKMQTLNHAGSSAMMTG